MVQEAAGLVVVDKKVKKSAGVNLLTSYILGSSTKAKLRTGWFNFLSDPQGTDR